jgi:polyhydroxybutyrate depolymerase
MAGLKRCVWLIVFLSGLAAGCTASLPRGLVTGPRTYAGSVDIVANGSRRSYLVHVPAGYTHENPMPLVVVIHGAFDTAEGIERISGFSRLSDREGFVVLYPNGIGILGFLQHWNAGHCCGKAAEDGVDDVGFVAAAIEDVCTRLKIDRKRVFMTGFSNGGMLTYRFAAERGEILAAAAPMAASIGGRASAEVPLWRIPEPVRPLPLLVIHGLADDDVRYEGGASLHRGGERTYLSVEESVRFWVGRNGCRPEPAGRELFAGRVLQKSWSGCPDGAEVSLYLIRDWGHVWPGGELTRALAPEDPLRGFDAAGLVWDFFKSQTRR